MDDILARSRTAAKQAMERSSGLWYTANRLVWVALMQAQTTEEAATWLEAAIPPEREGEPVALGNIRAAIRQLRAGEVISLL